MIKVYETTYYYQIDGQGDWIKVGGRGEILEDRDGLPDEDVIFDSWSWNDVMDYLTDHNLLGFWKEKTLFRKRPYLICFEVHGESSDSFYEGDFKTMTYKRVYRERSDVPLQYIVNEFPAEKCVKYFQERGIAWCPLNNTK